MTDFSTIPLCMNVGEFVAFLETRPDEEKWELIDGRPVLSPSPVYVHQIVVGRDDQVVLQRGQRGIGAPLPGPVAAVGIGGEHLAGHHYVLAETALEAVERADHDVRHRGIELVDLHADAGDDRQPGRAGPEGGPQIHDQVPRAIEVTLLSRSQGFHELRFTDPASTLALDALGVALPLASLYRDTGLV